MAARFAVMFAAGRSNACSHGSRTFGESSRDTNGTLKTFKALYTLGACVSCYGIYEMASREAENTAREDKDLPRVGEGWIGETELYYAIKNAIPERDVVQHARPKWLGRQHLDVFVPSLKIALEYQGEQHDTPIDFFGGQEVFAIRKKLDARKRRACKKNGVTLIEVRPGYNLQELIERIRTMSG